MRKEELIERIEDFPCEASLVTEMIRINKNTLLGWVKELDEPQKVTIPQFMADWLEKVKNELFGLNYDSVPSEIYDWVYEEEGNLKKLHLACAIGYTVEKEPKYTVKCKTTKQYLFNDELGPRFYPSFRTNFTKSDLEKLDLGWVFDCEGIEIEEVE